MAKPIKETPVLKGKDARNFIAEMKRSENKKASVEVRERIKKNFDKFNAIAQF